MKLKTSELTRAALDWAVAEAQGISRVTEAGFYTEYANPNVTGAKPVLLPFPRCYSPSTRWAQGGPIIEREQICLEIHEAGDTRAHFYRPRPSFDGKSKGYGHALGPSPLIAAMRCYVASRLGPEVDVPDEIGA